MCGIAGIFEPRSGKPVSRELVERMTSVLRHRGPDEGSVHVDGSLGLGHRRLSIIDVASGSQPIWSEDGTQGIIFNGEIYNYRALRDTLARAGHRFRTQSDTEAILAAYREYGERCVERLRGMFAFAIWDARRRELFLARDRVGIKPLYYYWDGSKFLFASEIKAILEDRAIDRRLDPPAIDEYLTYLYVPAPRTAFRDIHKLRAGHTLTVSERGISERRYWDLDFTPREGRTEEQLVEGLLDVLKTSVDLHMISEVPLGAFLSGGVDSSAVVALMAALTPHPVNTASIGFRDADFDELEYARLVARRYGTNAHERIVDAHAARILDSLVWHYDEPFADSSMIPTYYVSQAARERVTVCLSGDGGDENFAGYRRYRFDLFENRVRAAVPAPVRRAVFGPLSAVYPKADWLPRMLRAKTLLGNLSVDSEQGYYRTMRWFAPSAKRSLFQPSFAAELGGHDPFAALEAHFERARGWDPLSRVQYVDVKTYLVDDILTKVDRASMAHSLEVRVPLLDHEVMEYVAAIPACHKLKGGEGKHIFKRAVRDLVPAEILNRPKMGFTVPLARWLRGELKSMFEDRVLAPDAFTRDLVRPEAVRSLWLRHQSRTSDFSPHLWALLVLECWGRKFLRGAA